MLHGSKESVLNDQQERLSYDPPECLTRYVDRKINYKKKFSFSYSLLLAKFQVLFSDCHTWDEIIPNLFLGQILTQKEAVKLKKQVPNLKLIVSVVEPFEFGKKHFPLQGKLQSIEDYKAMGLDHLLVNTPDFTANLPKSELKKVMLKIFRCLQQGGAVYVHCKAGMGRSATLVALYLIFIGLGDPKKVYGIIKSKRKQVNFHETHFECINECRQRLDKQEFNEASNFIKPKRHHNIHELQIMLDEYVTSLKGKQHISQLPSIKSLETFGSEHCNSKYERKIKLFINNIANGETAFWFLNFLVNKSPLHELLDFHDFDINLFSKSKIKFLGNTIETIKQELLEDICNKLYCKPEEILELNNKSSNSCNNI